MVTQADMVAKLSDSGLSEEDAEALSIRYLTPTKTKNLVKKSLHSFQIPYFNLDGSKSKFWRLRYILEDEKKAVFGKPEKRQRYTQPVNATPQFYLPPILHEQSWADIAEDTEFEIIITEGELKAACACKNGYATIGLGGVWSWKSKAKKKPLIADFYGFKWDGRCVYLVFDSDLSSNIGVQKALRSLALELTALGAVVYVGFLPEDEAREYTENGKVGLDDFIVQYGAEEFETVLEESTPFEMGQELWKLNEEVAYVQNPGFIVIQDTGQIITPSDFTNHAYSNRFYYEDQGDKMAKKPAAKAWIQWPYRFNLDKITYSPGDARVVDAQYNSWRGWGCIPKKGSVKPWKDLMAHIFRKDYDSLEWFEKWCAIQFQRPGTKLFTAVLFWGVVQGSGKSLTGFTLGEIFGENFSEIGNSELHSGYNTWATGKQFVLIDEIASADKRERWSDTELLKRLITQQRIYVNEKFIKNYYVPDCVNYFMTSNNPDAIRMDNTDRRFFIKEIMSKMSVEFYKKYYYNWLKKDGASHLFDYFLSLNLKDFDPAGEAPITVDKSEMTEMARTGIGTWVHDLRENPEVSLKMGEMPVSELWTSQQLVNIYDPDKKGFVTANSMARELKKAGFVRLPSTYKVGGKSLRLYAVKRQEYWLKAKRDKIIEEYRKFFGFEKSAEKRKKAKF